MLRELLGFCVPLLLSTPLFDSRRLQPSDETGAGWFVWMLKAHEEAYMRVGGLYGGEVIAITPDNITVQRRGWPWPRTLTLAPALVFDNIPLVRAPGTGHRIKDIRLGDMVQWIFRQSTTDLCVTR